MCGRFTQAMSFRQLADYYALGDQSEIVPEPRYNLAPMQQVSAVRLGEQHELELFWPRWGLVPAWAKDSSIGHRLFNARAEGLAETEPFKQAFRYRRCLIPADGFYEWSGLQDGRQPYYLYATGGNLLTFAALWEAWRDPATAPAALESCTIITTAASADMVRLHNRMPAILAPEDWWAWLSRDSSVALLESLLRPAPAGTLSRHPVSRRINVPRAEGPSLITPLQSRM